MNLRIDKPMRKKAGLLQAFLFCMGVILIAGLAVPDSLFARGSREDADQEAAEERTSPRTQQGTELPSTRERVDDSDAAAVVNGAVISTRRFEQQVQMIQQQYATQGMQLQQEQLAQLKEDILESLIDQELLYQEAERKGMTADQSMVDTQMQQIKGQFPDEETYRSALAQQGMTDEELVNDVKKGLTIQRFLEEEFTGTVEVTEADAREFYNANPQYFVQPAKVRASHILIGGGERGLSTAQAREEALALKQRIEEGEEFSEVARQESDCPSGAEGGDLGFFGPGDMVPEFEQAVFAMEVGEISDPVETMFGFHIIRLTAKEDEQAASFGEARPAIEEHLYQLSMGDIIEKYLDDVKQRADIDRRALN